MAAIISNKKIFFIIQISDNSFRALKCICAGGGKREFSDFEHVAFEPSIDDKKLTEIVSSSLKRMGYNNNQVIISLPRSKATCRYIKIPTQQPKEIGSIISLQVPRYLPYPPGDLISGYQVIGLDVSGYSQISLAIVHKDLIERYLCVLSALKINKVNIFLSSYGLSNLYSYLEPDSKGVVMLLDIDTTQVEVIVINNSRLVFSRYFRFDKTQANWQELFVNEVYKTREAYSKEVSGQMPSRLLMLGRSDLLNVLAEPLNVRLGLNTQKLLYENKISISQKIKPTLASSDISLGCLFGFGIRETEDTLNLLPLSAKERTKKASNRKEIIKFALMVFFVIFMFALAVVNNINNKKKYLARINGELKKVEVQAKSLETIEKRIKVFYDRSDLQPSALDLIYELYQVIPSQVSLVSLTYEENTAVVLHGAAPELTSVFALVSKIEKSPVFKDFTTKVRYATKKLTQKGEVIDFEIVSLKKK